MAGVGEQATAVLDVRGGCAHLIAAGEFDLATAKLLADALVEACDAGVDVVLDMAAVSFIDASALRVVVWARNRAAAGGCRITIVNASGCVRRVLTVTGLDDLYAA